jgi:hypothetical protein
LLLGGQKVFSILTPCPIFGFAGFVLPAQGVRGVFPREKVLDGFLLTEAQEWL